MVKSITQIGRLDDDCDRLSGAYIHSSDLSMTRAQTAAAVADHAAEVHARTRRPHHVMIHESSPSLVAPTPHAHLYPHLLCSRIIQEKDAPRKPGEQDT